MEVLTETVKVIVEKVVGYAIGAVARQMGYLIHFKRNVENLSNKVGDLEDARKIVEHKVEAARMNVEEIEANVQRWQTRVQGITAEVQEFVEKEGQAKLKCFNLKARYQIGKKAQKMGLAVKELKVTADTFHTVGHRVPIEGGTTISTKGYEEFESRKSIFDGVMKALKDDNIPAIGVCGMGGLGKTMLVGKIATQAIKDKLFERIVTVVVSQTPNLKQIQKDIAKELELKFKDEDTDFQKAHLLRERLKKEKVLLIVDDIWNKIDLDALGISFGDDRKGSKLLLTSRFQDVLDKDMDAQEIFQVGILSDNEAKFLFVKIAGDFSETMEFQSTMVEVVKECAGLPIAITTVANTLKKQKNLDIWKDAVGQLKRANPTQIKEMHEMVYSSIKLSYDFLTKEAQSLFLFCSIFEEDKVIQIDLLWRYLVGLDFFEDVYTVEEVRNRVYALVNSLKDSCLLLEGTGSGTFKMHDVIRDVAIYIADKEEKMSTIRSLEGPEKWLNIKKWEDSFGIALFDVDFKELPEGFGCPQLKFIFLGNRRVLRPPISNNVFEGMKELRVLVLINASLSNLSSISGLHNLQSLFLDGCKLEDVALIGELKNLRALTLSNSNIKQLPMEIRQLTRLQLLNLNYCFNLEVIPSNVFSDLRGLEVLYMNRSFNQWHVDGEITERNNTRVSELDHMPLLTTLYIHIPNPKILPKALLFEKLKRDEILIGNYSDWDGYWHDEFEVSRTLKLQLDRGLQIDDGIKVLLKSCEYLDLNPKEGIKNILYEVDKEGFPQLKHLYVRNSTEIQYIVNLMEFKCVAFPVLQSLSLYNIENLEEICHDQVPMGSFLSLKKLKVRKCEKLTSVFSLTKFGCFSQLQEIKIEDCKVMFAIFSKERKHEIQVNHDIRTDIIDFTQLRSLYLQNLPNLVGFHPDADSQLLFNEKVAFSNLEEIYIKGIDNLKMLWHNHQLVPDSFCKIKKLHVGSCKNLMNIFPPNMLRKLRNLEELTIKDCNSVEEVFEVRGENVDEICDKGSTQLRHLTSSNLPKLKHVWTSDPEAILTFQNLHKVKVSQCKTLKSLFPISVAKSLEQLESLLVNDCGLMEEIVALEEGLEITTEFVFPRITSLSLELLPELKYFYPGKHTSKWPSLKVLKICKCNKVRIVFSNELSFPNTDGLDHHVPVQQPLFLVQKDTFPNLKELDLDWNETMNQTNGRLFGEFFCKLEVLRLYGKDDKLIAVPSVFVEGLRCLKSLSVTNLFFDNEGQYAGTFERLTELKLYKMPKLMLLWKENSEQGRAFQNLEILSVSECGRLKNLVPSSMHFRNLNILSVWKCHGLISFATSSTVKSLVQLKRLYISECKRMREIVTNEGEGEAGDEICFNQLEGLYLEDLPSLRSFHLGNRTIKFPSLEDLIVAVCPEMKIFSNGVLSMPKLKKVGLNENEWWAEQRELLPEEDVNSAVKRFWEENYDPCVQQLFTEKTDASTSEAGEKNGVDNLEDDLKED
ncbi:probable disease resistance protein At4g27220 [Quercus robur]|uniref:probable disease resistance protein At4g27220 n=1 Tax=Quercus robur TaxID=38942 RepID=UPI0021610D63|nr:probable disease resistance protein At4g27220 [Quercus robur]XP_050274604.1 probable disease resistance protein At4g27220 [Quercus robur]XP_050274605.1 probable disease resistance protein At4g27220 [Quercus robur]XP_050274606.1 probable disease resistance protein At4g27220 [Quercus robur]XP_050274607.1 probable disease resistance protein At4g27220 [Quercus robur]XP_050274608.1 probable disease resistance protein At4g27220 [Quercus robur]XP_050274609.1 probable disease resistance protein At